MVSSYLTSSLLWALIILGHSASTLWPIHTETLDACEREGKQFCYTGVVPDRYSINKAIRNDPHLLAFYQHRSAIDSGKEYGYTNVRRKREASTDCASLCCVTTDTTAPFSFFRDKDGWHQVATTPEFPLRVTFFTETCTNGHSPCRGVRSADQEYQSQCQQVEFRHAILVYNRTLGGVQTRYVNVPSGCQCKLLPKNPFKQSASSGELQEERLLQVPKTLSICGKRNNTFFQNPHENNRCGVHHSL